MPLWGGAGFPCNTMSPGPRPTSALSFIWIDPTVWPQYTNVTDRHTDRTGQTGQRSDTIERTVLQTGRSEMKIAVPPLPDDYI